MSMELLQKLQVMEAQRRTGHPVAKNHQCTQLNNHVDQIKPFIIIQMNSKLEIIGFMIMRWESQD